jgi:signal peptidase I
MTEYQDQQGPVVMQPVQSHSTPPSRPPAHRKREGFGSIASTVAVLLIAPLVALLLTSFVFQSYQVDGPSMETTLLNNDRLLVWKLPKTWSRITGHQFVPQRGDVIIFVERALADESDPGGKQLIKRVIALPGERVVIRGNSVMVYNKERPKGFSPDKTLPYGSVIKYTEGDVDQIVPEGTVYVMGDNRPNSRDSRSFGPVDLHDVVGKLVLRVWPINEAKVF